MAYDILRPSSNTNNHPPTNLSPSFRGSGPSRRFRYLGVVAATPPTSGSRKPSFPHTTTPRPPTPLQSQPPTPAPTLRSDSIIVNDTPRPGPTVPMSDVPTLDQHRVTRRLAHTLPTDRSIRPAGRISHPSTLHPAMIEATKSRGRLPEVERGRRAQRAWSLGDSGQRTADSRQQTRKIGLRGSLLAEVSTSGLPQDDASGVMDRTRGCALATVQDPGGGGAER